MQKRKFCHIELLSGSLLFILLHALFAPSVAGHLVFITSASMVFYTKCDASVAIFTMVIWYVTIVHAWNPRVDRWWGWRVSVQVKEGDGRHLSPTHRCDEDVITVEPLAQGQRAEQQKIVEHLHQLQH